MRARPYRCSDRATSRRVETSPAPVPITPRIVCTCRALIEPHECLTVPRVCERAEHVELREPALGTRRDVRLQLDAMHTLRVLAQLAVDPSRIDEGRTPHEIVCDRPAQKGLGGLLPRPVTAEFRVRRHHD